jgi:prevent-host-death family protein
MTKQYSMAEIGDHLAEIVDEAEAGTTVELTRRGRPVVVLLPANDYERLAEGRPDFWSSYQALRRDFDFAELAIDPDSIFSVARDLSPGRDFSW